MQILKVGEESVLNLVFKRFPEISFRPLLFAFVGIIKLAGLKSETQKQNSTSESLSEDMKLSSKILILEIQPVGFKENEFSYKGQPLQIV